MKTLTADQIAKLASKKGAKSSAVENFLGSLGGMSRMDALMNLTYDAASYKWKSATVSAIRSGILLALK
jgi:hypothetical protein